MKRIRLFENFDQPGANAGPTETDITRDWPEQVKTPKDAEQLLLALAKDGMMYHFDDDPKDVVSASGPVFTPGQAERLKALMDQAFKACEPIGGLWEGLVKGVFMGYTAFTADQEPITADIYVVDGEGPDVRQTTYSDYVDMQERLYDEDKGYDESAVDAWFKKLKKA